jgi:hypothetical protein
MIEGGCGLVRKVAGFDYLKGVVTKLPTWTNSRLDEVLPHRWGAPGQGAELRLQRLGPVTLLGP